MDYLNFTKDQIVNLEFSLGKELVRTNRSGAYSSTTIVECNTRKYHGLLVAPIEQFGWERYVLLSALDVTVVNDGRSFNTGIRKYNGDYYSPKGHKYMDDFRVETIPERTFRVGSVLFKMERLFVHREEQLLVRYTILKSPETVKFQVRPFLAFRNIHCLTHANMDANTKVEYINNGVRAKMYEGFPYLNMQFSIPTDFIHVPDWYKGVEYIAEKRRGYDYSEDLFTPGFFEFEVNEGDVILFSASTKEEKPMGFKTKFTRSINRKIPRNSYKNCLINAARQFVEHHNNDTWIVAGYPWFGSWGRDSFIALPGIATAFDDGKHLYREVLDTQIKRMRNGLFPNMGSGDNFAYNTVDASMWFFWDLQNYIKIGGTDCYNRYWKAIETIIRNYKCGTENGIVMHENGLIYAAAPNKALTWMDAVVNGTPITQRAGYDVEINALWYNAICFALELAETNGEKNFIEEFQNLPALIKDSFIKLFWNDKFGYLADYVDGNGEQNLMVRPNMLIAASLPYSMLSKEQMKKIVDIANKELVTSRGLRTLSPVDSQYRGRYVGNQEQRDSAYHQGTAWPWLLGPFCDSYLKVYGKSGVNRVHQLIYGLEEVMGEHGITTISEIYDGDPPHQSHGTISQAWSVGEVLRIMKTLEEQTI